ncbi:MAG: DEAD/DEAH box helicase family protein [Deltaproteobacteria bacterium]
MKKSKTKVNETLGGFLFNKIEGDPDYVQWAKSYKIPDYITENLHPTKQLRGYPETALKRCFWLYDNDRANAKHLLFNMATGAGKTLVMASVVLFLYEKGYRNFLFLVHQIQIKDQAVKNFTDYKFDKYLFSPKGIKINGRSVDVRMVESVADANLNAINFMFFSTSLLYNRLKEDRENGLTAGDFAENDIVIIADEAHRLNVDTRSKNKTDIEEIENWETAVMSAIKARGGNILLEFTATVDLANRDIHEKYTEKIVHRYDFLEFNRDGYSKDVKFLFNQEVHTENQKRLLIINAVALSEYRRLLAEREMGVSISPIVLIKSVKIAQSEDDRKFFDSVISSLRPEDLSRLKELSRENKDREHEILADMFAWLSSKESGLVAPGDWDGLKGFTAEIRARFAHENTLIYNSQKKEKAELLPLLDSPRNTIRAIFSVNALNEGWDVLGLFDIVHFDISEAKKVSLQDIQLIGRGARYCPYELPKAYKPDEPGTIFGRGLEFDKYKRKFDNAPFERGRALETFVYHFVKTGTFLENLRRDLLGEGIISEGVEKKTISMKQKFLDSDTYKKGFVLVNRTEKRTKTLGAEIETTFRRVIKAGSYNLRARGLSDVEQNQIIAGQKVAVIRITEEYFPMPIIRKALVSAEGNFFRFNNLSKHIVGIGTIDELIEKYLPLYEIKYTYEEGKGISQLSPTEKLQLLVGVILPEVRSAIDVNMPRVTGSKKFRPVPLSAVFGREKNIHLMSFPVEDPTTGEKVSMSNDERAKAQSDHDNPELQYDIKSANWYAYDENYGTSEEKKFVKYIASQMGDLRAKYAGAEIYLIRNELDYWLFSPQDGRRFSPDYMLIVNDAQNGEMYYQALIEPKGGHLLERDAWKEEALISLADDSEVVFDSDDGDTRNYREYLAEASKRGYKEVKPLGLKFYNSDPRGEADFALEFQAKLLS